MKIDVVEESLMLIRGELDLIINGSAANIWR
jgi:hypothetical protein